MTVVVVRYKDNCIYIKLDVGQEIDSLFQKIRNVYVNYTIQVFDNRVAENVIIKRDEIIKIEKGFIFRVPLEPMQYFEEAVIFIETLIFTFQDGTKDEWSFHRKFDLKEIKFPRIVSSEELLLEETRLPPRPESNSPTIKTPPKSLMEELTNLVQDTESEVESNAKELLANLSMEIERICYNIYELMLSVLPKVQDKQQFEMTQILTESIRNRIQALSDQGEEEVR